MPILHSTALFADIAFLAACGGGGSTAVVHPPSASATSVSLSTTQPVGTSAAIQFYRLWGYSPSDATVSHPEVSNWPSPQLRARRQTGLWRP